MKIKIESVQTICEIGPLCRLYAEFEYCLRILSSLASPAGAGAVLYQNHIRFPSNYTHTSLNCNHFQCDNKQIMTALGFDIQNIESGQYFWVSHTKTVNNYFLIFVLNIIFQSHILQHFQTFLFLV